mgnify:CR=1 FL=1
MVISSSISADGFSSITVSWASLGSSSIKPLIWFLSLLFSFARENMIASAAIVQDAPAIIPKVFFFFFLCY